VSYKVTSESYKVSYTDTEFVYDIIDIFKFTAFGIGCFKIEAFETGIGY